MCGVILIADPGPYPVLAPVASCSCPGSSVEPQQQKMIVISIPSTGPSTKLASSNTNNKDRLVPSLILTEMSEASVIEPRQAAPENIHQSRCCRKNGQSNRRLDWQEKTGEKVGEVDWKRQKCENITPFRCSMLSLFPPCHANHVSSLARSCNDYTQAFNEASLFCFYSVSHPKSEERIQCSWR